MSYAKNYQAHVGSRADKFFKTSLFQGEYVMIGLNCLEPGQVQATHDHPGADKAYVVMEGIGRFNIGDETLDQTSGSVVWAPAGVPHGVENVSDARLVLLVAIAPPPGK